MFFAYNNGITATAEEIELVDNNKIKSLKNFQIVNGGQTTASLFNTKKMDKADLKDIFIQMKLTIINDEKINEVVPNISRFSNTPKIRLVKPDFFSNDILSYTNRGEIQEEFGTPIKEWWSLKKSKWVFMEEGPGGDQ